MRRWLILLVGLVAVISAGVVRSSVRAAARRKREARYSLTLGAYARALHTGVTRKEVEDYLRTRDIKFNWVVTAFGGRTVTQSADLVKIGEEAAPWYCSEEYVYVAFESSAANPFDQSDSDVLERIETYRPDTGCL